MFNHPRGADTGVLVSATAFAVSWFDVANQVVQFIAGLIAIASGVAALWFYIQSNRRLNKQPKDYDPDSN